MKNLVSNKAMASLLLRVGVAFTFLYASVSALKTPELWIDYVPAFITKFMPAKLALDGLSIFQLILVVWLLSGKYLRLSALVAAGMLLGIVAFSPLDLFIITFRDVGLGLAALALIFMDKDMPELSTLSHKKAKTSARKRR